MKTILKGIDSTTEWSAKIFHWLATLLVLVISYTVIMRYVFNASPMWGQEVSMMTGIIMYVFAFVYALKHNTHVRVDVFYMRLPVRSRAIIDTIGDVVILAPLCILLAYTASAHAIDAYTDKEIMMYTGWMPPSWPWRSIVALAWVLFALQAAARLIRNAYIVARNKNYD